MARELQLAVCVAGIYVFYLMFGYLQENIMSQKWGVKGEKFNYTSFLLLVQSIVNAFCAGLVVSTGNFKADVTPFYRYLWVSMTSIFAMFCSNSALLYIDYPTQVLAKSCKPIPVMLMGVLVFRKKYSLVKYSCVFMVAIGIALFMMPSGGASHKVSENATTTLGIVLLFGSLALDGMTGPFQDDLIKHYKPSSPHLMFYSNMWASFFMLAVVVMSGDAGSAVDFCLRYPEIIREIAFFSICSALGQNFIYYTIHQFGALTCTTITTTRKFFTILASVIWFGHAVSPLQWFAVALVFAGLIVDMLHGYLSKKTNKRE